MDFQGYAYISHRTPIAYELDHADGTANITLGTDSPESTFCRLIFKDAIAWRNFVLAVAEIDKDLYNQGNALEPGVTQTLVIEPTKGERAE